MSRGGFRGETWWRLLSEVIERQPEPVTLRVLESQAIVVAACKARADRAAGPAAQAAELAFYGVARQVLKLGVGAACGGLVSHAVIDRTVDQLVDAVAGEVDLAADPVVAMFVRRDFSVPDSTDPGAGDDPAAGTGFAGDVLAHYLRPAGGAASGEAAGRKEGERGAG
jgi:hypothetical protein